jgi:hypothetical protein
MTDYLDASGLFRMGIHEHALQVVEFLAGFGQFTFRSQALIIGEVLTGLRESAS